MEKELPINLSPFIRALPQYAFLDAVINNNRTNTDQICCLDIQGLKNYEWRFVVINADVRVEDEVVTLYRKGYGLKPPGGWYRYFENDDEIIFNIKYQQYSNRWDCIIFFLDIHNQFTFTEKMDWKYKFTIHCCGSLRIDVNGTVVFYKDNKENQDVLKWFKIKKCQNRIEVWISADGLLWDVLYEVQLSRSYEHKKFVGGFYISIYKNQYFKWLCNNFIQIRYDKDFNTLGYTGLMNRDWRNYAIHPILRFSYDKKDMINHWGFWDYIVTNINSKRYLEVWLNELYVDGAEAYQKRSFNHENLIYGYNDKRKTVKILCVYGGKLKPLEVPIEILQMAWQKANGNNTIIRSFEYSPDEGLYDIDIEHISAQLREFLLGTNSTVQYQYIAERETGVFGIDIYNTILDDFESKNKFLNDRRIAYLIMEHKECMLVRMECLCELGIISAIDFDALKVSMNEIVRFAKIILSLVIKNQLEYSSLTQEKIWRHLKELQEREEYCYGEIVNLLEVYLNCK